MDRPYHESGLTLKCPTFSNLNVLQIVWNYNCLEKKLKQLFIYTKFLWISNLKYLIYMNFQLKKNQFQCSKTKFEIIHHHSYLYTLSRTFVYNICSLYNIILCINSIFIKTLYLVVDVRLADGIIRWLFIEHGAFLVGWVVIECRTSSFVGHAFEGTPSPGYGLEVRRGRIGSTEGCSGLVRDRTEVLHLRDRRFRGQW